MVVAVSYDDPSLTPPRLLCRCLNVTEAEVVDAIECQSLCSVQEVVCQTRAGGGCTACLGRIKRFLAQRSGS